MVIVAVAGGTGGVGKTIVKQLELSEGHTVFVLSRTIPGNQPSGTARFIKVDYSDTALLARCLEENKVEAVISTINLQNEAASNAQLNLMEAAEASVTKRRFIPSEFAFANSPDGTEAEPTVGLAIKSVEALRRSSLEFTRFANGFFMDYWGIPHVQNVAKFVVRTLESPDKWPEISILSGSDVTFNQLLAIAENIRALEKNEAALMQVRYGGGGGASEDEAKQMVSLFGRMTTSGGFRLPTENRINDKFLGLRPTTAEELLTMAWAGK
ncbi:hypothetical protein CEP54_006866 [Fusarium duplospermum]|uniref:NmrA-like domain-containing protein n=1 Tax=Fusarium duplospermum TaxID=1325734 RepID=A0A428Q4H4_9HYPO|nr:hypothetical protein CEP54_006866 [Fusarium duplospermum]